MTLHELAVLLWRRRLIVVVCGVLATAIAVGFVVAKHPQYQASAVIEVHSATPAGQSGIQVNIPDPLVNIPTAAMRDQARTIAGGSLPGSVSASVDPTTGLLTIVGTAGSARGATTTANAYAAAYVTAVASAVNDQVNKLDLAMTQVTTTINTLEAQDPSGKNPSTQAQVTSQSQLYASLASQKVAIQVNSPYATVQSPATPPGAPAGSSKFKVGGIGLLVGLMTGGAIAVIREQFDNSLRSDIDVQEATGKPVVGELPLDRMTARNDRTIGVIEEPQSLLAESVRDLRTSIRVLLGDRKGMTLAVTSASPGDGKTTVAANLGAALAMVDRRVVVVSADFRRPRIEAMFGVANPPQGGLAALTRFGSHPTLSDQGLEPTHLPSRLDVEGALVATRVPGLALLPSGGTPTNPSELLDGPAMTAVLEHLREIADVVVFDVPPVLAVTDAVVICRHLDGVLVVAGKGDTDREHLVSAVTRLTTTGAEVLGVVLNRVGDAVIANYHPYLSGSE